MVKKLKNTRLARAENMSPELRKKHNLPDKGMVVVETWEDDEVKEK